MNIPLIVLGVVFFLIAVRHVGRINLAIWQSMSLGAIAVLVTGEISPGSALDAINLDVMGFLFGMFVVGRALEQSGLLSSLAYGIFSKAKNVDALLLFILFSMGLASALLMNDTLAIIGTPIVLLLARQHHLPARPLLLALAFAITIGSVMSPIGNPQNLLIAVGGEVKNPFVSFFRYLALPTLLNLLLAYLLLKWFFRGQFTSSLLAYPRGHIQDHRLAALSKLSLLLIVALMLAKISTVFAGLEDLDFRLTYIALSAAAPIVLFSQRRAEIIRTIDWHTLIFFAAMFILTQSVWETGFFQELIANLEVDITSLFFIMLISISLSQVLSNVPLVALYLPTLLHTGASTQGLVALAAGSTIAGNLSILGAASNIIIIQNAEEKAGETLTFLEFAKIGVPLTALNALCYWLFLEYL
jgi:Na+/H+ antiporter NhaD/arsenite permease-like protein